MKKLQIVTSCLMFSWFLAPEAVAGGGTATSQCERLLTSARDHERRGAVVEVTKDLYRRAFSACTKAGPLPLKLDARLEGLRGSFVHIYENDPRRAVEIYETALERVGVEGGHHHPARIELLEGLARAHHATALRDDAEGALRDRLRSQLAYEDALRVRRAVFGEDSIEAARGLLLVAASRLPEQPELAESYARQALQITERVAGPIHPVAFESLVMLESSLREQGKSTDADTVREQVSEVLHELEERGIPLEPDR
jgi:tetratricopeptide (TPR) repeat protein